MFRNTEVGVIGVALYCSIFTIAIWRLWVHCVPYCPPIYATRKVFHFLLCVYSMLQIVSFQSFISEDTSSYTKTGYACHLLAIWIEITAFSLVVILWSKTLLSVKHARRVTIPFLATVVSVYLMYVLFVIYRMHASPKSFKTFAQDSNAFMYLLVIEPIVLGCIGGCVLMDGHHILQKLAKNPAWSLLSKKQKRASMFRLVKTLLICCACFAVRAILEILAFCGGDRHISGDLWFITSNWLPTLIPACVLMYSLRRPDTPTVTVDTKRTSVTFSRNSGAPALTSYIRPSEHNSLSESYPSASTQTFDEKMFPSGIFNEFAQESEQPLLAEDRSDSDSDEVHYDVHQETV